MCRRIIELERFPPGALVPQPRARGGVVVDLPYGKEATRELARLEVLADYYRPNVGIRIAPHLYTSDDEVPIARLAYPQPDADVQAEFARSLCIKSGTLQKWQHGRRKPDATTRACPAVLAGNRQPVPEVLLSHPEREVIAGGAAFLFLFAAPAVR